MWRTGSPDQDNTGFAKLSAPARRALARAG